MTPARGAIASVGRANVLSDEKKFEISITSLNLPFVGFVDLVATFRCKNGIWGQRGITGNGRGEFYPRSVSAVFLSRSHGSVLFSSWGMRWIRRGVHPLLKVKPWIYCYRGDWFEALNVPPAQLTNA